MKISTQGFSGSYHHQAVAQLDANAEIVSRASFRDVFEDVSRGLADAGVIAIENTTYGTLNENLDQIRERELWVYAEMIVHIQHQLIGYTDQPEKILSHPIALEQCHNFLTAHYPKAQLVEMNDTATAVQYVAEHPQEACAAIASRQASELHKVPIQTQHIADFPHNMTRFYAVSRTVRAVVDQANRCLLVFEVGHRAGSLAAVLTALAHESINLSMLVSRPVPDVPFSYRFYALLDTNAKTAKQVFTQHRELLSSWNILGSFVACEQPFEV